MGNRPAEEVQGRRGLLEARHVQDRPVQRASREGGLCCAKIASRRWVMLCKDCIEKMVYVVQRLHREDGLCVMMYDE